MAPAAFDLDFSRAFAPAVDFAVFLRFERLAVDVFARFFFLEPVFRLDFGAESSRPDSGPAFDFSGVAPRFDLDTAPFDAAPLDPLPFEGDASDCASAVSFFSALFSALFSPTERSPGDPFFLVFLFLFLFLFLFEPRDGGLDLPDRFASDRFPPVRA